MGRWQALAIASALVFAAAPGVAQGGFDTPGARTPEAGGGAAQLYEDVQILRTVRALNLTSEQLDRVLQLNARVMEEREELAALRERTWAEYQDEIEAVLEAWMEGEAPSSRDKRAADNAVDRVNGAQADFERARRSAAESLYAGLSAEQRRVVESPGAADERLARTSRMGGTERPGEYVLSELDAIRDLMPDEFRMLATAEAGRIARAIVGPDAANLEQMTGAVLGVLQEVYAWPPDRYREQRAELPAQIEAALGIEGAGERAPVPWEELMRLTGSTRTAAVVAQIRPAGGGEAE